MMLKMKCFGALASCVLATGALYADPTYSQTFDGSTDLPSGWVGGTVTGSNVTYSSTAGLPISSTLASDANNVLVIEGNTTYSREKLGANGTPLVDMMVQTARPDDELGFPSSETTSDIHIAVAVDSNGCFNAYCKNQSDAVRWYKLSDTQYPATGWARVSFLFDYPNARCQVRIDGEPVMSTNGYLTATSTEPSSASNKGAWYKLANDSANGVASMKVIGCTAIDEVLMNVDSATYKLTDGAAVGGIPCAWYDQYGISWNASATYDDTEMTAAEKFNACLAPYDGQTFAIKSVTADVANSKAVVGIPATVSVPGRQVVLEYGSTPAMTETPIAVSAGDTTVNVDLPAAGAVQYFRLKAKAAQ